MPKEMGDKMNELSTMPPADILNVHMFGGLELVYQEASLTDDAIRSEMLTKLLVYFLCHRDRMISVQELSEALWQDDETDNPVGALKNLVYRLRNVVKTAFGKVDFIATGRGTYCWNKNIPVNLDAERFEQLCKQAQGAQCGEEEKIAYYREAVRLYRGPFLPKLGAEGWVVPLSTYYHSLYLSAVKEISRLLEKSGRFDEMAGICTGAIDIDALDEELHYYLIKALAGQGKQKLAIDHYTAATALLYENLGIKPSSELRNVYEELLKEQHVQETDLNIIQQELEEASKPRGAFFCEYGIFKNIYRLQARSAGRYGMSIYVALLTMSPLLEISAQSEVFLKTLNVAMADMQEVLKSTLRMGDVVARYSGSQFVILLPTCSFETASMVMERLLKRFHDQHKRKKVRIQYSLAELNLPQQ